MEMNIDELPYHVGGLLYTPALNKTIADKLISGKIKALTSLVFCLEDSIMDDKLEEAEEQLKESLTKLIGHEDDLPLLFVRVRTPKHMAKIHEYLGELELLLTGYVLPKFDTTNADEYISLIREFNIMREKRLYIMPILESRAVADIQNRVAIMEDIKRRLDSARQYVLNVRVGGNDFSNMYGLRRSKEQSIYDIGVIRDILVNIINVFAKDYVVSGPVWEYFGTDESGDWANGLRREIGLDLINGFVGKTAIHPSQLPVIFESLKVSQSDYEDARNIADWRTDGFAVSKGAKGDRMNEVKCHLRWAKQILTRAKVYGVY
ncbi:MAG: HpcH/HpaI aldolase/citrate lyase family protein [Ruminococcus sp.]|nr:HpcH/HpaI aldolase/citrate lyase family protein [Ruminococcus sp.]